MFDSISNPRPARDARRGPASVIVALLSCGAAATIAFWPAPAASAVEEPAVAPLRMVAMTMPAPAGGRAGSPAKAASAPRREQRPAAPAAVAPAVPTPTLDLPLAAAPPEAAAGVGGGTPLGGGQGSGSGEGTGSGEGNGAGGSGSGMLRAVHWTDLEPTHREVPDWPAAGLALGGRESSCVVRLVVDPNGITRSAHARACAAPFEAAATAAALRWRFAAFDGPDAVQFDLNFVFRR